MGLKGPVTNLEDMRNRAFTLNALVDVRIRNWNSENIKFRRDSQVFEGPH